MFEWLRRQWNKLNPQAEQEAPAPFTPPVIDPILLPDTNFKTSQYLYQAGLLGGGPGSHMALGEIMNINAIVKAASKPAEPRSEQQIALMRELLGQSHTVPGQEKSSLRLLQLMANPPSIDAALKLSDDAGKGLDRLVTTLSFGRLGKAKRATEMWADIIGLQQAEWALGAYRESLEAKEQNHATRAAYYGALAGVRENAVNGSHGHYLQSALYTLEHPEMLHSIVRKEDLIEDFVDAAREPGGKRLSLGELMARGDYIRDLNGAPLPYESARASVDAILLQKTADRMHQIGHAIPDTLPKHPEGDISAEQAKEIAQHLRGISEKLAMVTQPESKINKEPDYETRQDKDDANPLRDVLNDIRGLRRTLSTRGHALSDELVDVIAQLERGAGSPEMQTVLKEQLHATLHKLEDYRDVARMAAANSHILAFSAAHSLAQTPQLGQSGLAASAQAIAQALPQHYAPELLAFEGSVPELVEKQRSIRAALAKGELKAVLPEKPKAAAVMKEEAPTPAVQVEAPMEAAEKPAHETPDTALKATADQPHAATEASLTGAATEEADKTKETGKAAA